MTYKNEFLSYHKKLPHASPDFGVSQAFARVLKNQLPGLKT
jgi:hypothetical protein